MGPIFIGCSMATFLGLPPAVGIGPVMGDTLSSRSALDLRRISGCSMREARFGRDQPSPSN
jgi:hypothetical protein